MPNSNSAVVRPTSTRRRVAKLYNRIKSIVSAAAEPAAPGMSRSLGNTLVEPLETRTLMSVSHDAAGYTVVTPGAGDRVIYVSASGNDGNSGTSPNAPIRSLSRGVSMLRSGTGDQLLLKRGDSFSGTLGFWTRSGRSSANPMVVGTYGTGNRPVVNTGSTYALSVGITGGVHDVDIMGIKFVSNGSAVADGFAISGRASNLLIEDCEVTRYVNNIVLQKFFGPITNVTVRRSVVTDSTSRAGRNSEGLFAEAVNGLTLEDNVFDHNGWGFGHGATVFNHDAYIRATTTGFVARGNIFANASSHGLQARAGGIIENNVFINNATGMSFGLVNGSPVTPGGVSGRVTNNIFMGTHNIGGGIRGVAIEAGNIRRGGSVISGNIIANGNPNTKLPAIQLSVGDHNDNAYQAVGINDLSVSNNVIYNWSVGLWLVGGQAPGSGPKALNNLTVANNQIQRIATPMAIIKGSPYGNWSNNLFTTNVYNKYFNNPGGTNQSVSYADPTRSPGKMVGGSNDAFVAGARSMNKSNWNSRFTANAAVAYVKAGFNGGGSRAIVDPPVTSPSPSPSPTPTPTTPKPTTPTPTSGFASAWIDFTPASGKTVGGGFKRDNGNVFANRGNGLTYGWNVNHTDTAVARHRTGDPLVDTNIGVKRGGKWEIAVANGKYKVMVAMGDSSIATTNTVRVEGHVAASGLHVNRDVFAVRTVIATVSDGKLTIDNGSAAALLTRLAYLKITKV